jgi:hypothetical protein
MNDSPGNSSRPRSPRILEPARLDDEQFAALRATAAPYTALILTEGPNRHTPGAAAIILEHGRRNAALHLRGTLPIVCPVLDDTRICGLGIFNATLEETTAIMNGDPGVQAGIFTYQLHPVRSFPGSTLPPAPSAPSRTRPTQPDA